MTFCPTAFPTASPDCREELKLYNTIVDSLDEKGTEQLPRRDKEDRTDNSDERLDEKLAEARSYLRRKKTKKILLRFVAILLAAACAALLYIYVLRDLFARIGQYIGGDTPMEAVTETMTGAVTETEDETATEAAAEAAVETASEAPAEDVTETAKEAAAEAANETITESAAEAANEAITEAATEAENEAITEAATEDITETEKG